MSGPSWILLNLILIVGAVYGTMKVRSAPPQRPLHLEEKAAAASSQHKATTPGEKAEAFDFLLPMGWDRKMWENFRGYFGGQRETD